MPKEPGGHRVFLCHNHRDKPAVKEIAHRLLAEGISPWLDEWELRPGQSWQAALEEQIREIPAAAVFVGKDGLGPWQSEELAAFLRQFVKRKCPVIPVVLPDCEEPPELPVFLEGMTWVDFRKTDPDPLAQLIWGVTGNRPDATPPAPVPARPAVRKRRWPVWTAAALIVAAAYAVYLSTSVDQPLAPGDRVGGQVTLWRHTDGGPRQVGPDHVFYSGDRLRFEVSPSHDGFLFVLHRSADGELQTLWPRPGRDGAVSAHSTVVVPSTPDFLRFDATAGEEEFYVAIAAAPNAESNVRELIEQGPLDGARVGRSIELAANEHHPTIAITRIRLRHTPPPGGKGMPEDTSSESPAVGGMAR